MLRAASRKTPSNCSLIIFGSTALRKLLSWRGKIWNSNIFSFFLLILLVFSFIKSENKIKFLDFDHHDVIYMKR